MKRFKTIDFCISVLLILASAIYWLLNPHESFLIGYFVVGSWQAFSMIVHVLNRCFTYGSRNTYHWISLISVLTMPIGSIWILIFTAPFMAVYYTWLCYHEVSVKMQRPLSVLR